MPETFSQILRQIWIDAVIDEDGEIGRPDICRAFGIATAQASADLGRYMSANPGRIAFDRSVKTYRSVDGTRALYRLSARNAAVAAVDAVRSVRPTTPSQKEAASDFPPPHCTAWEDCKHDGICHDFKCCGATGPNHEAFFGEAGE